MNSIFLFKKGLFALSLLVLASFAVKTADASPTSDSKTAPASTNLAHTGGTRSIAGLAGNSVGGGSADGTKASVFAIQLTTAAVPEPSYGAVGIGLLMLCAIYRLKSRDRG